MGAANFASPENAKEHYVVLTNTEEKYCKCDCGKFYEGEEEYVEHEASCLECEQELEHEVEYRAPEMWEINDFKENLADALQKIEEEHKQFDFYPGENNYRDLSRNYCKHAVGEFHIWKMFGDVEVILDAVCVIQSAYYEGATLDYIWLYDTNEYDSMDEYLDDIFEYDYNTEMNAGLCTIMKRQAKNWLENQQEFLSTEIEKVYQQFSSHRLNRVGTFSNGVAIYEPAETS